jgi:tripartite-type tricarboxylate transporter receptor subunit TctC
MNPWVGAFAPAGTPRAITERLHAEINKALKKPELRKQMSDQAVETWTGTHAEFVSRLKADYEKFQKIFKMIGTPAAS